uniref:DUF1007 family protein n=1 Tax=Thaumasiovibrio occultus TaxID=1891184 RepID=UPI000B355DE6|nr:DUF1007 family protein [Thaumasiovibrio occultus]
MRRILFLVLTFLSTTVWAHPHSWMFLTSQLQTQAQQIKAITFTWAFDPMTSSQMVMGKNLVAQVPQTELDALLPDLMLSVAQNQGLSEFYLNGERLQTEHPTDPSMTQEKSLLVFRFTLPFSTPVTFSELAGSELRWTTFEPTYYVSAFYKPEQYPTLPEALAQSCTLTVIEPEITDAMLEAAKAIDQEGNQPQEDFGKAFAQTLTLRCQP